MPRLLVIIVLFNAYTVFGQYHFSGEVSRNHAGKSVYLSLVEDYRKSTRVYLDQIIRKAAVDSLGHFQIEGDNLLEENRIYRIHLDGCSEDSEAKHFLGQCNSSSNVLFIANNKDTISFPTSFEDQALCTINATNPKASLILEIGTLKEEMVFDFMEFRSEASQKLNSKKWFGTLQSFGSELHEPLAELIIYDFLSDKRNETYSYYLEDLTSNSYYSELLERLQIAYPNSNFTKQYEAEIAADKQMASFQTTSSMDRNWFLITVLCLSLVLNAYLIYRYISKKKNGKNRLLDKLTPQEQKIVDQILREKSNKEIAAELFVSHSTVKTHINNLYKKLEVSTRQEIVALFKK
ncbi:MAG: helix-turn-helix transcriptional regulator [Bacteroidota bacterium]